MKTQKDTVKEHFTSTTTKKEKPATEIDTVKYDTLTTNEIVVERLLQMKKAIEDNNKEALFHFFDFPIKLENPLMMFIPYHILLEKGASSDTIIKKDFLELAEISKESKLYTLLTTLDVTVLKKTNSVEKDVEEKGVFCYYMYSIHISDDKVTLMYGSNTSKYAKNEEDWCPESNDFITFKIVKNRIVFDKYDVAG